MNKLLEFSLEDRHLPDVCGLLALCRAGATRCFMFHNKATDELMPFACVQLSGREYALYAQPQSDSNGSFHFETVVEGGLKEAIAAASGFMGNEWTLLPS